MSCLKLVFFKTFNPLTTKKSSLHINAVGIFGDFTFHHFTPKWTEAGFKHSYPSWQLVCQTFLWVYHKPQHQTVRKQAYMLTPFAYRSRCMHAWTHTEHVLRGHCLVWSHSRVCLACLYLVYCANCFPVLIIQVSCWVGCFLRFCCLRVLCF